MATARKTAATTATATDVPVDTVKTRKPRRPTVKASALDLTIGSAPVAVPAAARVRKDRDNPFDDVLAASYEANDEGADLSRQVVVPHAQVEDVTALIRNSANHLNIGARIFKPLDNGDGTATLQFRAQKRRARVTKTAE